MVERGTGHLVFISSLSGKIASAGASIYNATKFGLRGFGFALNEELRGTGVGATTVFPGFIRDAGMFADSGVKLPRGVGTRTPGGRREGGDPGIEQEPRRDRCRAAVAVLRRPPVRRCARALVGAINRRLGADPLAEAIAEGQRDKR